MAEYTIDKFEYSNNIYNLQDNITPTFDLVAGINIHLTPDATNNILTITATDTKYSAAKYDTLGLVKPAYSTTGTASFTTSPQAYTNSPTIAARSTTSGKYYGVEIDKTGRLYVNIPWADTKVTTAALTSGTLYYPILATGAGTATRQIDSTLRGLTYKSTAGTTSASGSATLILGNNIATGTANNEEGIVRLYAIGSYYTDLMSGSLTANKTVVLPSASGTLALDTIVTPGSSTSYGGLMSQADKTKLDNCFESVSLTQAEYDALSTSEKTDSSKIYYITDVIDTFVETGNIEFNATAASGTDYDLATILTNFNWINDVTM